MNAANIQALVMRKVQKFDRTFPVTLFNETREVAASGYGFGENAPLLEPTRFSTKLIIALRYRTGKKLHLGSIEIETNPEEVERLTRKSGWKKGNGFAFRITSSRHYGNFRSGLFPVGWADKYPQKSYA